MALFSRRVLQRYLEENAAFVTPEKLRDCVQRLNRVSNDYLATEWEVALLHAFAIHGKVQHEPAIGSRSVDLVYTAVDLGLGFAAEITCISDQVLHNQNPINRLREEMSRRVRRARIDTGRFVISVEEERPVPNRFVGRKRKLLLPPVSEFGPIIFSDAFNRFLLEVRNVPSQPRDFQIARETPKVWLRIQYQPGIGSGVGVCSYGSYTTTTVLDDNPLFNALKNKSGQLKHCGFSGIRGIIVCDGDSRIFSDFSDWSTFKISEVIGEFLRQNTSISFVATIGIHSESSTFGGGFHHHFSPKLFVRDVSVPWVPQLDELFVRVIGSHPAISETPINALGSLTWNGSPLRTKPYLGGWSMQGNTIRISSRELLDLLAGRLDQSRFAENHALNRGGESVFSIYRSQEKMLKSVHIERHPDKDDDEVILEFAPNDPAISPFMAPKTSPLGE